ncbi:hypothetical protein BGZ61DRAFT_436873 [Ilyonectria robusta]|uniref:uncharacterized protein n=1 Tax=Ilyonectria robusta TaxID=1079257 RepID=UPI001E8D1EE1|nr:uncharacterized protein BGZ61DRAFT_436873 [Ilyonectria robusta]KAH8736709.1 hypothetical protein BGZ61DRAFT_436873 [Ilyonectria robusta]
MLANRISNLHSSRTNLRGGCIHTPGFNYINRPDIDTLQLLVTYLGASYADGVRIHGTIMLHPFG